MYVLQKQKFLLERKTSALQDYGLQIQRMIARLQIAANAIEQRDGTLLASDKAVVSTANEFTAQTGSTSLARSMHSDGADACENVNSAQCSPSAVCPVSVPSEENEQSHLEPFPPETWTEMESVADGTSTSSTVTDAESSTPLPPHSIALSLLSCPPDERVTSDLCSVPLEISKDGQFEWFCGPLFKDANTTKSQMPDVWGASEGGSDASRPALDKEGANGDQHLCAASQQQLVSVS